MTATTTLITRPRRRTATAILRRLIDSARWVLSSLNAAWDHVRTVGQLGPSTEVYTSRRTGARI